MTKVKLYGVDAAGNKVRTANKVVWFTNDKRSIWIKTKRTTTEWKVGIKTHKGTYVIGNGNLDGSFFDGLVGGVRIKVEVKKIVAHLSYN